MNGFVLSVVEVEFFGEVGEGEGDDDEGDCGVYVVVNVVVLVFGWVGFFIGFEFGCGWFFGYGFELFLLDGCE